MEQTGGGAAMRILDGFLFALFPQKVYEIDTLGKKIFDDNNEVDDNGKETQDPQADKR